MDCRVLQLVIQSAHGLRNVNHLTTMKPYALVSIRDKQNNLHSSSEEKTPEDAVGGSNPTWNSPVTFKLDITKAKESSLELVVKLISFRTDHWFRDKEIGEVRVLITKLLEGFGGGAKANAVVAEKQMSASVMTTDEKPEGTLVFSYKFESVTTVQKPARHNNIATAPRNVQQNPKQPAGLVDPLFSKKVEGIAGTAFNKTGLTSGFASDAAAAPSPPAIQTRFATAVDQRGANDPSVDNNDGIKGNALNTTGLTSASNAVAAPPSPAIQTPVAAAVDQRAADDPSEDNNEGIAGTALNSTTALTSASDAAAALPSPAIQTPVVATVDQSGADDPSEDNNEGIAGIALNTTRLTSASDAAEAPPSPAIQTPVVAADDQRDQFEDNNEDDEYDDDGDDDDGDEY